MIVEDEPLAVERVRRFIGEIPYLRLEAVIDNGAAAIRYLQEHLVDLVFLDIGLGEVSGMDLLEQAAPAAEVILTTAYHEYAVRGFDLQVTDYLLKPFTLERFIQAVERARSNLAARAVEKEPGHLFIRTAYKLEKVYIDDILYIEGMRDYRKIHTVGKPLMTLQTFRDFQRELDPRLICRVHKSYMIAIGKIDAIERDQVRIGDTLIPVSDSFRKRFWAVIDGRG